MKIIGGQKYYLYQDLAAALNVSTQTVNRLMKAKRIPPPTMKVGVARLWDEKQFLAVKKLAAELAA